MKKLLLLLGITLIISIGIIFGLSYQSGASLFGPATTKSSTQIGTQSERVVNTQGKLTNTRKLLADNRATNKVLDSEIPELKKQQNALNKELETLADELELLPVLPPQSSTAEALLIQDKEKALEQKIIEKNTLLIEKTTAVAEAESTYEANKNAIVEAEQTLSEIETELNEQTSRLQSEVVVFGVGIARYLMIIIVYWIIYQIFRLLLTKFLENETLKDVLILIATLLTIAASIITLLIAFIGNIALLVTSFGVLSAALVVALQDLVSSVFAWLLIKARGPFKTKDVIEVQFNDTVVTGTVQTVGFLRTELREKVGGISIDREAPTGKTIFFPNNLILKQTFRNLTRENKLLWHRLDLTITFESDFKLAKKTVEEEVQKIFSFMVDHKDKYLEDVYNVKNIYQPKVYLSISENGPMLTIWYAVQSGSLRDVLERMSTAILEQFGVHGIDLAYRTTRVISTGEYDKPPKFLEPGLDI
jgi:small-conductance mechanosensitive channel